MGHGFYSHVKLQEATSGAWTNQKTLGMSPRPGQIAFWNGTQKKKQGQLPGVIRSVQVTVLVTSGMSALYIYI